MNFKVIEDAYSKKKKITRNSNYKMIIVKSILLVQLVAYNQYIYIIIVTEVNLLRLIVQDGTTTYTQNVVNLLPTHVL